MEDLAQGLTSDMTEDPIEGLNRDWQTRCNIPDCVKSQIRLKNNYSCSLCPHINYCIGCYEECGEPWASLYDMNMFM
jgi:hypothetical protein